MTVQDVIDRVEAIHHFRSDDEAAHSAEDSLHVDVLRAIATGQCDDPKGCAAAALRTLDIGFARWCA